MSAEEQIRQQVRQILTGILTGADPGFSDDADIFAIGLDSVSTVLLISELEDTFSISLEQEDIPYDQFRTIQGIASFVSKRTG